MNEQTNNFQLTFPNGMKSVIDENAYKFIVELEQQKKKTQKMRQKKF